MIHLITSLAVAMSASGGGTTEFGSGSTGNGGQSVVCSAQSRSGATIEAYDLFEGNKFFAYNYLKPAAQSGLNQALQIAHELDAKNHSATLSFADRVMQVASQVSIAPDQPGLPLTGDTDIDPTYLPDGCELVQVIVFHTPTNIDVNQIAFAKLAEHSKAALYLHEAIYWYLRETAGDTSSRRTRRIVSYLMSGGTPARAVAAMKTYDPTPVYCQGSVPPYGNTSLDHLLLLLNPAGRASLLILGAAVGNTYEVVLFHGAVPNLSLLNNSDFSPSQNARFAAGAFSGGELNLTLYQGSSSAQLEVSQIAEADTQVPLLCAPYLGVLP